MDIVDIYSFGHRLNIGDQFALYVAGVILNLLSLENGIEKGREIVNKNKPQCLTEPLWDVKDVSRILNVKEGTIRYWVHTHAIRFRKIGNLVRFIRTEVTQDFYDGKLGVPNVENLCGKITETTKKG